MGGKALEKLLRCVALGITEGSGTCLGLFCVIGSGVLRALEYGTCDVGGGAGGVGVALAGIAAGGAGTLLLLNCNPAEGLKKLGCEMGVGGAGGLAEKGAEGGGGPAVDPEEKLNTGTGAAGVAGGAGEEKL